MTATAPTKEIGYAQASTNPYNWWAYDGETTPELMWPQSVEVYDTMRRTDAQVESVLQAVTRPIIRTPRNAVEARDVFKALFNEAA